MNPDDLIPPEFRNSNSKDVHNQAADLIRGKIDELYSHEPSAKTEATEVKELVSEHAHLSKHQSFMRKLQDSGADEAEVQVKWHEYYEQLNDDEKRQVWQEFYAEKAASKKRKEEEAQIPRDLPNPVNHTATSSSIVGSHIDKLASNHHVKRATHHVNKVRGNHHFKSLVFGLSMGFLVIFIFLFSFFNERFIIPFIRPSSDVSATPIIVNYDDGPVSPEPKIIIPKINLEAPVVYDVNTIEEKAVQTGLERGVLHYSTTPNPGELGNSVIFGHSSGNILNNGKYKFAFLLLKSVDVGDTFIIQKDSKRYVYKIYNKYVTSPDDVSVLQPGDKPAMMTLITCDPPGTSTHRLIVQAEQIYPNPKDNAKSSVAPGIVSEPQILPSNSPSLWQRLFGN